MYVISHCDVFWDTLYLNHIVAHRASKLDISKKPGVVTRAEADLHQPLPVPHHQELWQGHIRGHLDRPQPFVPLILKVRHGVSKTLNLYGAQLIVHGEVGQVHEAGGLDCQADAPQDISILHDPQKLILCSSLVEQGNLLINKEGVRHPDEANVLRPHH